MLIRYKCIRCGRMHKTPQEGKECCGWDYSEVHVAKEDPKVDLRPKF